MRLLCRAFGCREEWAVQYETGLRRGWCGRCLREVTGPRKAGRSGRLSLLLMLLPVGYLAASILIGGDVVYG